MKSDMIGKTGLEQADQSLKQSEKLLEFTFASLSDAIFLLSDTPARIIDCNRAASEIFGYSRGELIGQSTSFLHVDGQTLEEFQRLLQNSVEKNNRQHRFEFRMKRKDGTIFHTEHSVVELEDDKHKRIGWISVVRDITERKRAEEALRQIERSYREVFDNVSDAIFVHDAATGKILDVNSSMLQMYGFEREEALSLTPDDASLGMSPYSILEARKWLKKALVFGPQVFEWQARKKDGQLFWVEVSLRSAEISGQQRILALVRDITERKRAEVALQQANASLEEKVQERTNELAQRANQLRALAGELTLAEHRERSRLAKILHDQLQQLLVAAKSRTVVLCRAEDDSVKRSAKEVDGLLDELIAASRSLTAELSPPVLREAGLSASVDWLAKRMAENLGLSVDLETENIGRMPEDLKILLFESIRELLFNVVKHARTSSASLNLRCVDGHLKVTVSDNGVGFDPQSISGPSSQGFGLFSIRDRLQLVGGSLEIKSSVGQGSRLVISLPLTQPRSSKIFDRPAEYDSLQIAPDQGGEIRVLIADDHALVRGGIALLLRHEPDIKIVGEAADGQEAVELAAARRPDIILMDVSMPRLSGIEATRVLHDKFPNIRVIGLSMYDDADTAQSMRQAGAVDYVTKSSVGDKLIAAIRNIWCLGERN